MCGLCVHVVGRLYTVGGLCVYLCVRWVVCVCIYVCGLCVHVVGRLYAVSGLCVYLCV